MNIQEIFENIVKEKILDIQEIQYCLIDKWRWFEGFVLMSIKNIIFINTDMAIQFKA